MSTSLLVWIVLTVVAVFLILFFVSVYNELTKKRILTQEGLSGVGACLQQRNDLIPNLVETVKGYAGHENNTLAEVIKWRNQSAAAHSVPDQNAANKGLQQALIQMMSLTESYPELKANGNFQDLMRQLSVTEEKINDARRYYNGTVRSYNQSLAVFPKNIVGSSFNFKPADFFEEETAAKVAPTVRF